MPKQPGFDFNDLHLHAGLSAVRDCIEAAVKVESEDEDFTDEYVPVGLDDFSIRVFQPNFVKVILGENGNLKSVAELDDDIAGAISSIDVATRRNGEESVRILKIKLCDKNAAL